MCSQHFQQLATTDAASTLQWFSAFQQREKAKKRRATIKCRTISQAEAYATFSHLKVCNQLQFSAWRALQLWCVVRSTLTHTHTHITGTLVLSIHQYIGMKQGGQYRENQPYALACLINTGGILPLVHRLSSAP